MSAKPVFKSRQQLSLELVGILRQRPVLKETANETILPKHIAELIAELALPILCEFFVFSNSGKNININIFLFVPQFSFLG